MSSSALNRGVSSGVLCSKARHPCIHALSRFVGRGLGCSRGCKIATARVSISTLNLGSGRLISQE